MHWHLIDMRIIRFDVIFFEDIIEFIQELLVLHETLIAHYLHVFLVLPLMHVLYFNSQLDPSKTKSNKSKAFFEPPPLISQVLARSLFFFYASLSIKIVYLLLLSLFFRFFALFTSCISINFSHFFVPQ